MSYINASQALSKNAFAVVKKLPVILFVLLLAVLANYSYADDDFLDPEQAFVFSAAMVDPLTLDVHYEIAPDYYIYQERFEVKINDADGNLLFLRESTLFLDENTAEPQWPSQLQIPTGSITYDPTFEKDMEVFYGQVGLRIPLVAGANGPLDVSITSQGCADSGLCYPPLTDNLILLPTADGYSAQGDKVKSSVPAPVSNQIGSKSSASTAQINVFDIGDTGMAAWLHEADLWQILALSLVFGALLSLTPCVLPMVPILLAVIAGQSETVSRTKGFALAAIYVLGMSIVYTILGVVAGLMGAGLAAWLQSPWVLGSFAVLLAIFALAMLDVFTIQTPVGMQSSLQTFMQKMPGGKYGSVFLMGLLSALIVGPCVAAPLAGILLFISQTGDVVVGGSSLFAMAWGEGILLLLVGAGAGAVLPKAGAWMNSLKYGFGILLLATAWWMAMPLINDQLYAAGWVVFAIWFALLFWQATSNAARSSIGAMFLRAIAIFIMLWAIAVTAGLFAGKADLIRPLSAYTGGSATYSQTAVDPQTIRDRFTRVTNLNDLEQKLAQTNQPVMLDFFAEWCVSCLEMEKFTFSDPNVARQMGQVLLLQADVTKMTAADKELLAKFDLFGPPGIMFFNSAGQYLPEQRVVGFKNAEQFGKIMDQVIN